MKNDDDSLMRIGKPDDSLMRAASLINRNLSVMIPRELSYDRKTPSKIRRLDIIRRTQSNSL